MTVFERYKYVLLIFAVGICLMLFTPKNTETKETTESEPYESIEETEKRLEKLLETGEGVGKVKVMLTLESSESTVYMQEESFHQTGDGIDEEKNVSIVSEDGNQIPLVQRKQSPCYRGACVLCEGAGNAKVRLWVSKAVSDLLGLGTDKISIVQYASKNRSIE